MITVVTARPGCADPSRDARRGRDRHYVRVTPSFEQWPPDGWEAWSFERRRIWRLERQLLRWEAFALAARDYAHQQATALAEHDGDAPPSGEETNRVIFSMARERGADFDGPSWPTADPGD